MWLIDESCENNNCEKKNFFNSNLFLILAISFSVLVIGGSANYAFYQSSINGIINGTIARWDFKANNLTDNIKLDFGELYPGKTGSVDLWINIPSGTINYKIYWNSEHTKSVNNPSSGLWYIGRYGVIKAGFKETIPIYFYWPYENNDTYSSTALTSTIKIIGRQYTGTSATLPINMLGLDFTVKTGSGGCSYDSYMYNTIGNTCNNYYCLETLDSTHGYFTY
mgnify:CR=1 FL=1